jgi:hypothetical protein
MRIRLSSVSCANIQAVGGDTHFRSFKPKRLGNLTTDTLFEVAQAHLQDRNHDRRGGGAPHRDHGRDEAGSLSASEQWAAARH